MRNTDLWIGSVLLAIGLSSAMGSDLRHETRAYRDSVTSQFRRYRVMERDMALAARAQAREERAVARETFRDAMREERNAIREQTREIRRQIRDAYRN